MTGSKIAGLLGFFLVLPGLTSPASTKRTADVEFYDPFEVMAEVERLEALPLWPGFDPGAVPVGLFDGVRTYLFGFPKCPRGFRPVDGRPGVHVHDGAHPAVFGNVRSELEGIWMASAIPARRSQFTGRAISLAEAAGIVIHEKFHVFQALRHPEWKPNDAVLLVYPLDTEASLIDRFLEVEALRRAVLASSPEAAAWARKALALRRARLAGLGPERSGYEREIQRFEGLAEYVEYRAAGRPSAEGSVPIGFAPKAIRELGYLEGRWIADLLDRFDPGWKEDIEAGRIIYLEDRLGEVLPSGPAAVFTPEERNRWTAEIRTALARKKAERRKMLEDMRRKLGITVVIEAKNRPLRFWRFDPFSLEAAGPRALVHSRWLSLKNDLGAVEAIGLPVLTETDENGRVVRLVISGLSRRPRLLPNGRCLFSSDGFFVSLRSVRLYPRGFYSYIVKLF
jgi:hypothetical protein